MERFLGLLGLVLIVASCASGPPLSPKATLAFEKANAMLVPAGEVVLMDNYKPPLVAPNIEHKYEVRPAHVARRWIAARTKAISGAPGAVTLTIGDASVIEEKLEVKTDWKHMFSRQPDRKFTANLVWRLTYNGPQLSWSSDGTATSTQTVLEESSLNQVDADYGAMIASLAAGFDQRLQQQLGELRDALASVGAPLPRR